MDHRNFLALLRQLKTLSIQYYPTRSERVETKKGPLFRKRRSVSISDRIANLPMINWKRLVRIIAFRKEGDPGFFNQFEPEAADAAPGRLHPVTSAHRHLSLCTLYAHNLPSPLLILLKSRRLRLRVTGILHNVFRLRKPGS